MAVVTTRFYNFGQAVQRMAEMVVAGSRQEEIANCAVEIVRPLQQGFPINEAAALCRYVQRNIRYTNDTYNEDIFRTPQLTLKLQSGDCNNKAVLFGALARAIGFPVRLVFLFESNAPDLAVEYPLHVWAEVEVYKGERRFKKWVACEATPLPIGNGRLNDLVPFGTTGTGGGARIAYAVDDLAGGYV